MASRGGQFALSIAGGLVVMACGRAHVVTKVAHLPAPSVTTSSHVAEAGAPEPPKPPHSDVCEDLFGSRVCDPFRPLEDSSNPDVVRWATAEDARTRARWFDDARTTSLYVRMLELAPRTPQQDEPAAPKSKTPRLVRNAQRIELVTPGAPAREIFPLQAHQILVFSQMSPTRKFALVVVQQAGQEVQRLLARQLAPSLGPIETIESVENSAYVWDEARGGFYYEQTPQDDLTMRFARRNARFHRIGSSEPDPIIIPATHDMHQTVTSPLALVDHGKMLLATLSADYVHKVYGLVDVTKLPPRIDAIESDEGDVLQVFAMGDKLLAVVGAGGGRAAITGVDLRTHKTTAALRRFQPAEHFVAASPLGLRIAVERGEGHHQAFEILDASTGKTIASVAGNAGERLTLQAWEGHVVVWREGMLLPRESLELELATSTLKPLGHQGSAFDASAFVVDTIDAVAEDGVTIPVEVLRKKDTKLDGSAPLWASGYGGFGFATFPHFSSAAIAWAETGGLWVVSHLRGGTEIGLAWHEAAARGKHMRAVLDMVACTRELHRRGYGAPARTVIQGASNGGLLAARVGVGWPELAAVVFTEAPLIDMLRFQTRAPQYVSEYGDPTNAVEFPALLALSPYYQIRAGTMYPSFFIVVAENDERAHPSHGAKLAAALEAATSPNVSLQVRWRAGHITGGTDDERKTIAEAMAMALDTFAHGRAGDANAARSR